MLKIERSNSKQFSVFQALDYPPKNNAQLGEKMEWLLHFFALPNSHA